MTWFCYWTIALTCRVILQILCRVQLIGGDKLAPGPILIISNHTSHFDPPFIAGFLPGKVEFMATQGLFSHPLSRLFFTALDVFPVDREKHDSSAVRRALDRLKMKRRVFMFPEGGIRSGSTSLLGGVPLNDGVASLCSMASAPVQPLLLIGSDQLYDRRNLTRRPRAFLVVGDVLQLDPSLPKKVARAQLTRQVEDNLKSMFETLKQDYHLTDDEIPMTAHERWARP